MPAISVLMSVYNGEKFLAESVRGILSQTFKDFEFVIVNDGSTDQTSELLSELVIADSRIKLIKNSQNLGLTRSLNSGLRQCTGKYIARMDADDVSAPNRFVKQFEYMENNPQTVLCGALGWYINEAGDRVGEKNLPTAYGDIKKKLLFNNQFIHSSLFIQRDILEREGGYSEDFKTSQDYELILRLADKYSVVNLPDRLINWRVRHGSLSWSDKRQEWDAIHARWRGITEYNFSIWQGMGNMVLRLIWLAIPQKIKLIRHLFI